MTGVVFNIQSYSLHDGPGIRTTVFLKGCPLRCQWCSNPESQNPRPEIYFDKDKCIYSKGCDWCESKCPHHAIHQGKLNFDICDNCQSCVSCCPSRALAVYGKIMTAEEVVEAVEQEQIFYRHGSGGLTLSGGEPLFQADFTIEILKLAKSHRIHTAIETCGYCRTNYLHEAAKYLDYIFFDIKLIDEAKHITYTNASNRLILNNLQMLFEEFPNVTKHIRTPIIPSVNDNSEDISDIKNHLKRFENYTYELLPYHRFGQKKYTMLGRNYPDLPLKLEGGIMEELNRL